VFIERSSQNRQLDEATMCQWFGYVINITYNDPGIKEYLAAVRVKSPGFYNEIDALYTRASSSKEPLCKNVFS
jgi:hypothetical protein